MEGTDYENGPFVIVFDTTVTSGDERCVTISILDDDVVEGSQSFSAVISSTTPAVNFDSMIEVVVTIEDTDSESCKDYQLQCTVHYGSMVIVNCKLVNYSRNTYRYGAKEATTPLSIV